MRTAEQLEELFEQIKTNEPGHLAQAQNAVMFARHAEALEAAEVQLDALRMEISKLRRESQDLSATCMGAAMSWTLAKQLAKAAPAKEQAQ